MPDELGTAAAVVKRDLFSDKSDAERFRQFIRIGLDSAKKHASAKKEKTDDVS